MSEVTLTDLYMYDAIEAGFKLEIAQLREFYEAATAPKVMIVIEHAPGCSGWRNDRPCTCDGLQRQERIDKAFAALAEDSEDDASEVKP